MLGLRVAVIPHYDNAEGGTHDTRFCYLGERRLQVMEAMLDAATCVLGIDEHTAAVFDLTADTVTVLGRGGVTLRDGGVSTVFDTGSTVGLDEVRAVAAGERPGTVIGHPPGPDQDARGMPSLRDEAQRLERVFDAGLRSGDIAAAVGLREATTGDTLCDPQKVIMLEKMIFPEPVIHVAVEPKTKADQEKMGIALNRLAAEDPSFRVTTDHESGQTIIKGMGELHLEILVDRMKREFKVEANVGAPQVAYREYLAKPVDLTYTHKKQSGGSGQFGEIKISVIPGERGSGFQFFDEIKGGNVPKEYIPSVEKGLRETAERPGVWVIFAEQLAQDLRQRLRVGEVVLVVLDLLQRHQGDADRRPGTADPRVLRRHAAGGHRAVPGSGSGVDT